MPTLTKSPPETRRIVHRDGLRQNQRLRDAPGRPTLLLVHGYPDCSAVWSPLIAALGPDWRIAAPDVRGAGRSQAPRSTAGYRIEHLVDDLCAVVEHIDDGSPIHLVGHDWGSIQSWAAVCDPRLSGRIASFTSVSGPALPHIAAWIRHELGTRSLRRIGAQALRSWYVGGFHLPWLAPVIWSAGLAPRWPKVLAWLEGMAAPEGTRHQGRNGRRGIGLYRANVIPALRRTETCRPLMPVQVLIPRDDPFLHPSLYEQVARELPDARIETIDGGHWAPLSRPAEMAAAVTDFVRSAEGSAETPGARIA